MWARAHAHTFSHVGRDAFIPGLVFTSTQSILTCSQAICQAVVVHRVEQGGGGPVFAFLVQEIYD